MEIKNTSLLESIIENYTKTQIDLINCIDILFEKVSFLQEKKHLDSIQSLSLLREFIGPFKRKPVSPVEEPKAVVSNEEKSLMASISNATKMTKGMKAIDMSNVDAMKTHIASVVDAVLDVHEKEMELDPVEISPEVKNAIDMLFGMVAYNLNLAKNIISQNLAELSASMLSSRLKASMMKYRSQQMDPQAMLAKMNIPLSQRLGSFFSAGLNHGSPPPGAGGVKVR